MPPQPTSVWHGNRENVFVAMRRLGDNNEYNWKKARELGPVWNRLSVGSADFDHKLKALVGDEYLRSIRIGGTPDEAYAAALLVGIVETMRWNEQTSKTRVSINEQHELKIWDNAGVEIADNIHLHFLRMVG